MLAVWRQLSVTERASIVADWSFWARTKQLAPGTNWYTWGFLTGRGFGKTLAVANFVIGEAKAGRAPHILLLAQNEDKAVEIQVEGVTGLLVASPPWYRPTWEASAKRLTWPNGATATVGTPEVPGAIRGPEYELAWITELQSWPTATREEALDNVFLSTRRRGARIVWDCTPKRRHPLLERMLADGAADPARNVVIRGTTHENAANLDENYLAQMERKFGGTARGREELLGEMLEDAEGALFKQSWIDHMRRAAPERFARRVVSLDPAVSNKKGSDTTGIVEVGLGHDGLAYVLGDASKKRDVGEWVNRAIDWYVDHGCDLMIAETNKGGQLVAQTLRATAKERELEVVIVGKDDPRPRAQPGKIFVLEVFARGAKEDRAEPVALAYKLGRVCHVGTHESLEDTLTTWEPTPNADSPGDLDALVHAISELLDLTNDAPNLAAGITGINELAKPLFEPTITNLATIFKSSLGRLDRGL